MICKSVAFLLLTIALGRTAAAGSTTVPMQLLGNFPVISVHIEGIDVPLVFDLGDGGSAAVLAPALIKRVKTLPAAERHRAYDAMGNAIQSGTFTLPRLQIGDVVFTDVLGRPDLHDPAYQSQNVGQQGYLGTALLQSYKVVLDYPHRQLTLISADSGKRDLEKCKGQSVPFLLGWNDTLVTKATTDFGERTAVWDTGAPVSILRRANAPKMSDDATEATVTRRMILGGTDFGPLKLDVADYKEPAGTDMFIGYTFFIDHIVCVDFPGKRFLIQR
jgi:hypothetical protein